MRTVSAGLLALLNSGPTELMIADCFTISLLNGTTLRYTDFELDVTIGGNTFLHSGPIVRKSKWKCAKGLNVDAMDLTISDDGSTLIGGLPILQALVQRVFDGANVQLDRAFALPSAAPNWQGPMTLFYGRIGDIDSIGRTQAALSVNSIVDLLNMRMPLNLFQPSCRATLFDATCTLVAATFAVTGVAVASGSNKSVINATLSQATDYFSLGRVVFTSGVNIGLIRSVKTYVHGSPSVITFTLPLPNAPGIGDAFTIYPGCDKTQTSCGPAKFNNLINFAGQPYVPAPETAI
jgi:uncharacterized phage protein (TIGR02218 family)